MNNSLETKHKGNVSVEYLVITLAMVAVLFFPLPGIGDSIIDIVVNAVKAFQTSTTHLLSVP